tara:strand:- start:7324 stop:7860 length:537 start_codon:yes stop_codon:yes gene_type:complete
MKAKSVLWLWLVLFSSAAWSLDASLSQYKLGSGDVIKITVFGQQDLSLTTKLPNHGVINYPFLGDLRVTGLTGAELEAKLYAGLKGDYLIEPSVSVTVLEYRPFFIDGEVKRPGGYPYQPGLSVNKAAALAGGYTERASKTKIFIRRESESGQSEQLTADSNDVVLPGDIVTVQQSFF